MSGKTVIMMDLSSKGKGGGPYTNSIRTMESDLKDKYNFQVLEYKTEIGRGISFKRIADLKRQIKRSKPSIVHFAGLQLSGFHVAIACWLAGVKRTLVTIHGFSGDAMYFHPVKKIITKYILEPLTLFLAKKVCGVSEYVVSRKVVRLFSKKCEGVIYNFPPSKLTPVQNTGIREELGLNESDVLVVSVARIIKDKGYQILEESIKQFKAIGNIKFVIVGSGDYLPVMRESLKKQVTNRQVFFLGHRDDVQNIHKGCDIFVLPTLHETLSIALLEASMEKLALVASDTGGIPEIIESGYNGILVEPGNAKSLAEAITLLYKNKKLREKLAANAREKVDFKFSNESIVQKIDNVYQSLLSM